VEPYIFARPTAQVITVQIRFPISSLRSAQENELKPGEIVFLREPEASPLAITCAYRPESKRATHFFLREEENAMTVATLKSIRPRYARGVVSSYALRLGRAVEQPSQKYRDWVNHVGIDAEGPFVIAKTDTMDDVSVIDMTEWRREGTIERLDYIGALFPDWQLVSVDGRGNESLIFQMGTW